MGGVFGRKAKDLGWEVHFRLRYRLADLDVACARRPGEEARRINVNFSGWMIASLDQEARRLGITRQSIIKQYTVELPGTPGLAQFDLELRFSEKLLKANLTWLSLT